MSHNHSTSFIDRLSFFVGTVFGWSGALHFINHNFDQAFPVELFAILVLVVAVNTLLYRLVLLVIRDACRAGIVTAVTIFCALNFDGLYSQFYKHQLFTDKFRFAGAGLCFMVCLAIFLRGACEHRIKALQSILAITGGALLAVHCCLVLANVIGNWGVHVKARNEDLIRAADEANARAKPDIYYIMPDDYVGNVSLSETYGFDNHAFSDELQSLGYFVPSQSFSNYPVTTTSLASSINAGLLDPAGDYRKATARAPVYELIRTPAVARFLQKQGYTFIQIGSWWTPTQSSEFADQDLQYAYGLQLGEHVFHVSESMGVFLSKTLLMPFLERGLRVGGQPILGWQGADVGRIFLNQTENLEALSQEEGPPRFVFAHLLMPHLPIVFDADGQPIPPGLDPTEAYLRQLRFTNLKLIEIARRIQSSKRGREAVIVMASDEGQFPANDTVSASDQQLRHKSNTFASLYFPDHDYSRLYSTITPVNYFRVIFNKYFGVHLALQPDAVYAYRTSKTFLLDLADVTARVRHDDFIQAN